MNNDYDAALRHRSRDIDVLLGNFLRANPPVDDDVLTVCQAGGAQGIFSAFYELFRQFENLFIMQRPACLHPYTSLKYGTENGTELEFLTTPVISRTYNLSSFERTDPLKEIERIACETVKIHYSLLCDEHKKGAIYVYSPLQFVSIADGIHMGMTTRHGIAKNA